MATVDVDGVSLFYVESGRGPPVVLVHGIPTDYRAWAAQIAALSDTYQVFAYSRRYAHPNERHGDLSDSTIENNAHDLDGMIRALGLPPVHLVGHSYGGFIAASFALMHPDRVRSLTLVEPAIAALLLRDPDSGAEKFELLLRHPRVALSAQRFLKSSNRPALAALDRNDLAAAVRLNVEGVQDRPGAFDALSPGTRAMMLDNGRTVREAGLPYPPLRRTELGGLRRPALVVHGTTSARWLRAVAEMTGASIPLAHVEEIPRAGHYPHLENPGAFNAVLKSFLAGA